jgi:hypothetical protein
MTTSTILQYNGVRLQNVQTLSFVETPVNDPSGQYLYTHTELRVLGYVTLDNTPSMGPRTYPNQPDVNQGATQQFAVLKHYLEQPRRRLVYSVNAIGSPQAPANDPGNGRGALDPAIGTPLFIVIPAQEKMISGVPHETDLLPISDVHGGPTPKNVAITHVANNQVWRVEFTVEFSVISPCLSNPYATLERDESIETTGDLTQVQTAPVAWISDHRRKGVLSNRWSVHDQIDDSGYTTRTWSGKILLANPNWSANDFRALTLFPLQPGMMRYSIDYLAAEDNMSLAYTVVDKEVTATAPWPARTMKIVHNEAMGLDGATADFSIRVTLTGDRGTQLFDLSSLALAIIDQRLYLIPPAANVPDTSVQVYRQDITTEQGTDAIQSITVVVSGKRQCHNEHEHGLVFRGRLSRTASMRPFTSQNIALLKQYDNQLSFGNRAGEQPVFEGSIPAVTALHSRLATPCTTGFGVESNLYTETCTTENEYYDDRRALQNQITDGVNGWSTRISGNTVGTLPDYSTDLIFSTNHKQALYSHYRITSVYNVPELNVALPMAITNPYSYAQPISNVVVQIGPRQPTRTIRVEAERTGLPPMLPFPLPSFTETGYTSPYVPGQGQLYYGQVTNTLKKATATHREPQPLADGNTLLYTSYLELEYTQNRPVGYHRFGIPAMIAATANSTPDPVSDVNLYSFAIDSMYRNDALTNSANYDSSNASVNT